MTRVSLEGDEAIFYQEIHRMPLDDLAARLRSTSPFTSHRLPRDTAFVIGDATATVYVIEKPPRRVTLRLDPHGHELPADDYAHQRGDDFHFSVWLPWEYYLIAISNDEYDGIYTSGDLHLFWARSGPALDLDHQIVPARIPNVRPNGDVCLGSTDVDNSSHDRKLDDMVETFYDTTFNLDLEYRGGFGTTLAEWTDLEPDDFSWPTTGWSRLRDAISETSQPRGRAPRLADHQPPTPAVIDSHLRDALPPAVYSRLPFIYGAHDANR